MGIRENWNQKTGKQKRNTVLIGVCGGLIVLVIAAMITDSIRGTKFGRTKTEVTQVVTPNQRNLTVESLAAEIYALRQQMQQQQANQTANPSALTAEQVRQMIAEHEASRIGSGTGPLSASEPGFIPPGTLPGDSGAPPLGGGGNFGSSNDTPAEEVDSNPYQSHTSNSGNAPSSRAASEAAPADNKPAGTNRTAGNRKNGAHDTKTYLPAGSQLSIIAVSGINAPTGEAVGGGAENAMPILLRVKGLATMANGFRSDLSDCVIIANAYGQLADERAYVRTKSITCIRSDGVAVEATMKGTVIGEDGKPGWRGRLVSRDGRAISQMIKIGMLNTFGQGSVALAGTVRIGHRDGSGNSINIGTGTPGQVALNSAAQGINDIFGRVASIYEKYAQQSFPVVEIQPMRTGDILLQEGISLEYVKDRR